MLDMTNSMRRPAVPGLALIGDAALAADPLTGVGCGWAFQSAEWLVDATADALDDQTQLDAALEKYRRRHRRELAGHEFLISDYSTGRGYNPLEKLLYSAAARDPDCADHLTAFGSRVTGVANLLSPGALVRAIAVNLKHRSSQANATAKA
jgi:menaquinone-9 beta-reductase